MSIEKFIKFISFNFIFFIKLIENMKGNKYHKLIDDQNLELGIKEDEYKNKIIIPLIKAIIITTIIQIFFLIKKIDRTFEIINKIIIITKDIGWNLDKNNNLIKMDKEKINQNLV